mmetsp:Transcript_7601/g.17972  ORF Transcript_7601/g.17972 Transcript_7601/m.17972 type:complete len:215 (+) Transcript_7601:1012-1656(+)
MLPPLRDMPGGAGQVGLGLIPDHDVGVAGRGVGLIAENHGGGRGGRRRGRGGRRGLVARAARHRATLVHLHEVGSAEMHGEGAVPVVSPAAVLLDASVGVVAVLVQVRVVGGGGGGDGGRQAAISCLAIVAFTLAAIRTVSVHGTDHRLVTDAIIRMPAGVPGLRGTIGQILLPVAGVLGALPAVVVVDAVPRLAEDTESHEGEIRESESVTIR